MPGELIPIFGTVGIVILVIFIRKYIHDERMAMIEKGVSRDDLGNSKNDGALKFGLLFIGAGIGLSVGYMLDELFRMDEAGYFSMLFIFGGLGLVVSHFYSRKQEEKNRA